MTGQREGRNFLSVKASHLLQPVPEESQQPQSVKKSASAASILHKHVSRLFLYTPDSSYYLSLAGTWSWFPRYLRFIQPILLSPASPPFSIQFSLYLQIHF